MDQKRYKHWWFNVFLPCIHEFTTEKVAFLMNSCSGHDKTLPDSLGQLKCCLFSSTKHNVYLSAIRPGNNCRDQDTLQDLHAHSDGECCWKFWWTSSWSREIAKRAKRVKLRASSSCVGRSKFIEDLLGWIAWKNYIRLLETMKMSPDFGRRTYWIDRNFCWS